MHKLFADSRTIILELDSFDNSAMAEALLSSSSSPSSSLSRAVELARIRKERREAKIKAGGTDRLNKISSLGSGIEREPRLQIPRLTSPSDHAADPDEVDISQHFYQPLPTIQSQLPQHTDKTLTDDQLRAMMLGFPSGGRATPPPSAQINSNSFTILPGIDGMGFPDGEDPMLNFFQKYNGGVLGEGLNGMPSFLGIPSVGQPGPEAVSMAVGDTDAYFWRIIHAVFALALGLYITFTVEFTGTSLERQLSGLSYVPVTGLKQSSTRFFYTFATIEVLLQTSHFYLEKGVIQYRGILGTVMGFLPQPWKGYLGLILRYSRIWTALSSDALVCVFVLGIFSWLQAKQS